ncbi:hypothetical protein PAXRUDRAFT_18294 [Paxillus rubicundulus Ve08.2h10]|uniref:Unplaced genomic scaffold scaffold_2726, whole genome shotgun sequence n=1 Tax=Paxillus rubicundulus Ve08.2h10 TaxID=930991 RepID=A0A0D0DF78_9AGAM|nr:hypothetical protein PAXRUDRAFT_18294 [Paxillus rubicundulus Ve08.2h10]
MSLSLRPHYNHLVLEEHTNPGPPVIVLAGARQTWDSLNARFRAIGAAGIFSNFSTAIKFKIHERDNVPAKLGELDGLFNRITILNLAENLRTMIMLSALPDSWDQLASTLLGTIALAGLTPATIIPRIHEESARRKEHTSSNRLNVIKHNNTTSLTTQISAQVAKINRQVLLTTLRAHVVIPMEEDVDAATTTVVVAEEVTLLMAKEKEELTL